MKMGYITHTKPGSPKKRDQDKEELEENILTNIEKTILPILTKLQKSLTGKERVYVEMLESNLEDIISPFTKKMSFKYLAPQQNLWAKLGSGKSPSV